MRIAAYVNRAGEAAGFYEEGLLRLYERQDGEWSIVGESPLRLRPDAPLGEVRARVREAASGIGPCGVFIASEVKGVPYAILEGMGYNIWKSEGKVEDQLGYVADREEQAIREKREKRPAPLPVGDLRDGNYRIDLMEVQANDSRFSTREILIPFLESATFNALEIICDHPPRWLGVEFERLKMRFEAQAMDRSGHEVKIMVYPR